MKKRGLLIGNGFIGGAGFSDAYARLSAAAKRFDMELTLATNDALLFDAASGRLLSKSSPDFAIFWDKDIYLALQLEALGVRLYNSARAVYLCDDKALTHIALKKAGIPMPKTVTVPKTFPVAGYGDFAFLKEAGAYLGYPMVLKECFGSFGEQVYLVQNEEEAKTRLNASLHSPMLMQEFIKESAGRDVRAIVVGGKVAAAMLRRGESGEFRANLTTGGTAEPYSLSARETEMALEAAKTLSLDFCGVDLLLSNRGPLVCEVNSNAHFKGIAACTGVDAAEFILEHIAKEEGLL